MKSIIKILASILITITIISCIDSNRVKPITINNKYSIDIPIFLSESKDLNNDASLQYCNLLREFYVIVIDESKKEFNNILLEYNLSDIYSTDLEGYTNILSESFKEEVNISNISESENTSINGLKANLKNITGTIDEIEIFYKIAYVEGKENYYQIMLWTLSKYKDKYSDKMDNIILSFKEI